MYGYTYGNLDIQDLALSVGDEGKGFMIVMTTYVSFKTSYALMFYLIFHYRPIHFRLIWLLFAGILQGLILVKSFKTPVTIDIDMVFQIFLNPSFLFPSSSFI